MNKRNSRRVAGRIAAIAIALVVWQLLSVVVHQSILIVGPWQVFLRLFSIWQVEGFARSIWFSFSRIVGGFLLGTAVGMICAVLAYKKPLVETLLWPWMATIKSVPVASFIVICLIWLSVSRLSIFISFLIVVPITYQNILNALKNIDNSVLDLGRLEDMSYVRMLKDVLLPQIREDIVSTVSITTGMSWKAGIAAEIIGTPNGSIGKQLYLAKIYLATDDLLAWTVIIVILSVLFEKITIALLKK